MIRRSLLFVVAAGVIAWLNRRLARRRRRPRRSRRAAAGQAERLSRRQVVAVPAGPQGRRVRRRSDDDRRRRRRHADARDVCRRSEGADRLLLRLSDGVDRRHAEQRHDRGPRGEERVPQQFARFGSKCRTFAPMYRQITLRGLQTALATSADPLALFSKGLQYDDVRDAWQHYLKNDNQGRGVVLIGHSQGAYILQALIAQRDRRQAGSEATGRRLHPRRDVPDAEGQGRRRAVQADPAVPQSRARLAASSTTRRSARR